MSITMSKNLELKSIWLRSWKARMERSKTLFCKNQHWWYWRYHSANCCFGYFLLNYSSASIWNVGCILFSEIAILGKLKRQTKKPSDNGKSGSRFTKTGFTNYTKDVNHIIDSIGGAPLIIKFLEGTQGLGEAFWGFETRIKNGRLVKKRTEIARISDPFGDF